MTSISRRVGNLSEQVSGSATPAHPSCWDSSVPVTPAARSRPRRVQGFYTKDELALLVQRLTSRVSLAALDVDDRIMERYYQWWAIRAIGKHFEVGRQRKAGSTPITITVATPPSAAHPSAVPPATPRLLTPSPYSASVAALPAFSSTDARFEPRTQPTLPCAGFR